VTYHNLYPISKVATPFVATENARLVVDRRLITGLVVKAMGPMGVNDNAQQAAPVPVKIQHERTTPK